MGSNGRFETATQNDGSRAIPGNIQMQHIHTVDGRNPAPVDR